MRTFIFFYCTLAFALSPKEGLAQNADILIMKDKIMNVKEAFKLMNKQADYKFVYRDDLLKNAPEIEIKKGIIKADVLLKKFLTPINLTFNFVQNNTIVVKGNLIVTEKDKRNIVQFQVSGTVVDELGSPLPGASIVEKGTTNGTQTDFDGNFSLKLTGSDALLVVSYIGYTTQEITVDSQTQINIKLQQDSAKLEEVVVVGYGTQNKRAVTSAIATISAEELGENDSDSFTRALSGKVAGVQVQQTTGAPGGNIVVRVRGTGSLSAGNDPLYVIDGFPVESSNLSASDQGFNPLSSLNPDDIESIQVLKDAAASAIYGSRGANGVVIITTKRGKSGKPQFSFSTTLSSQSVLNKIDLLSGDQFLDFLRESWDNAAATTDPGVSQLALFDNEGQYRGVNTDWQDEIFRTGIVKNYQLSATGGSDTFKYFVSGGVLDEEGIVLSSGFKRYSMRANLDLDLTDKLKLGLSLTPSYSINDEVKAEGHWAGNGVILSALIAFPFLPADASTEQFVNDQEDLLCCGTPNPVQMAEQFDGENKTLRLLTNSYLEYEILGGLKAKTSIGFDLLDYERNTFELAENKRNNNNNSATSLKYGQRSWLSENTLNYNKLFGKHSIDVLGGFTYQEYREQSNDIRADGILNTSVKTINEFDKVTSAQTQVEEWSLVSFLGRLNYAFDSKYFASVAIRRDGSSRFGINNKYATFPSASAGWAISEESFLKESDKISLLKLRASYGVTGNNQIGNYASLGLLQGGQSYVLGSGNGTNIGGVRPSSVANPDLTWETTKQYDLGLELGLFNNRIALTADYFNSQTEDLLLSVPVPATSGFTSALQNLGRIENKGWEFLLSTKNFTGDFKWSTDFNITFSSNEILELGPEGDAIRAGSDRGQIFLNEIGGELGAFNVYQQIGVFQTQAEVDDSATFDRPTFPGDAKYQDTNGDGEITDDDRVVIGSNQPDFIWGITNNFSYKNFDMSIVVNGVQGNLVHNVQGAFILGLQGYMNQYANAEDRWRSPSQPGNGITPRATFNTTGNNSLAETSRFVEDGSFTRIQNVTLGYNFPNTLTERLSVSSLRLFFSGNNLAYFTKYRGYNPEVSSRGGSALNSGADYGTYPLARRFSLGLKIGF